jgi:hypothetical protein
MSHHIAAPQPGLLGYWRFDEGSGSLVHDMSGRGGDGALSADTLRAPSSIPINCDDASPLAAPALLAPADGIAYTITFSPTLAWSAVEHASAYHLQLSPSPDFTSIERNVPDITGLSATIGGLRPGATYHWRVRAESDGGAGAWSSARSFTTGGGCMARALKLNGTDAFVGADSFAFQGRGVTVEFWNYVDSATVRNASAFSVGTGDDQANRFQSHAPWSDKALYWDFGNIGTTGRISTSYAPYLNRWTHVALVSNGIDFKAIYIDGEPIATSATASSVHDLMKLVIGGIPGSWYHPGAIDEFRVWNTPRTREAIRRDMFRRLPAPQSGLIGYWSLDEGSGKTAHDSSGFAHDGQLVNAAWETAPVPIGRVPEQISGPSLCSPDTVGRVYTVPFDPQGRYIWKVIGGTIVSGAGTGSITVRWTDSTAGVVALRVDRDGGCADSAFLPVTIRLGAGVERHDPVADLSFTGAPDPFSATTLIGYQLLRREHVSLAVYSLDGALVTMLASGTEEAGSHRVLFDGAGLPSGIYICRLDVGDGYRYVKALHLVR